MNFKTKIFIGSFLSLFLSVFWTLFYIFSLFKEKEELNKKVLKKIIDFHISFLLYPLLFFPFAFVNMITGDSSLFDLSLWIFIITYFINLLRYFVYFIRNKDTEESKINFLNKNLLSLDIFNLKDRMASEENKKKIKTTSKIYYFLNLISFWILWNIYFLLKYFKSEDSTNLELKDYYKNVLNTNLTYFISILTLFVGILLLGNYYIAIILGGCITLLTFIFFVYYLKNFILNVFHWIYHYNKFNLNLSKFKITLFPSFLLLISFLSFYFIIHPVSNYVKFTSYENKIKSGELKAFEYYLVLPKPDSKEEKNDFWYQALKSFKETSYWNKIVNQDGLIKELEDILFKYKWNNLEKVLKSGEKYIKEITEEERNKIKENELIIKEGMKELGTSIKTLLNKDSKYMFHLANLYPNYSNSMIGYIFYLKETNQLKQEDVEIVYDYCSLGKEMTEKEFWYISYLASKVVLRDCYIALYELKKVNSIKLDSEKLEEYENLKNNFFKAETEAKYLANDTLWIFRDISNIDKESLEYWKIVKFVTKISGIWLKSVNNYEKLNKVKTEEDLYKFERDLNEWQNSKFINYFIPSYWIEKIAFVNFWLETSYKKVNEKLLKLKITE